MTSIDERLFDERMSRGRVLRLGAVGAVGVIAAGCGGSSKGSGSASATGKSDTAVTLNEKGVARIDELSITLREIETGLVDFPALVNGRQVWLCWRLGEGDVEWWHELSDGFGGRRPLIELA